MPPRPGALHGAAQRSSNDRGGGPIQPTAGAPPDPETVAFIRASFRSVWALELLLFLRAHGERTWSHAELIAALRASDLIVSRSLEQLFAAGLIALEEEDRARYRPSSGRLGEQVDEVERLYARSPSLVRRLIATPASGSLAAFADAFRFWRS